MPHEKIALHHTKSGKLKRHHNTLRYDAEDGFRMIPRRGLKLVYFFCYPSQLTTISMRSLAAHLPS
jgi:hypothetical protein